MPAAVLLIELHGRSEEVKRGAKEHTIDSLPPGPVPASNPSGPSV